MQAICDRLGPRAHRRAAAQVAGVGCRTRSPAADRRAGYRYDISVLQAEFSLTQMLDKPVTGPDLLRAGHPGQPRSGSPRQGQPHLRPPHPPRPHDATPGRFRTRVINSGVTPSLHVDYKHSTIKQYHKEGRALRTETTINDPGDFGINKGLTNLPAMRKVGFHANRRLLHVRTHQPRPRRRRRSASPPSPPPPPQRPTDPGLRFGDPRAQALLAVLLIFRLHPNGFSNADLRHHLTGILGVDQHPGNPAAPPTTCADYACTASSNASPTPTDTASPKPDCTKRCSSPVSTIDSSAAGEAHLTDSQPPTPAPLRAAARAYDTALAELIQQSGLAA